MAPTIQNNKQISTDRRIREIRKEIEKKEKEKEEKEKELEGLKNDTVESDLQSFLDKKKELENWKKETRFKLLPFQEEAERRRSEIEDINKDKEEIELKEKAAKDPERVMEIEKKRWKVEDERRTAEKECWDVEEKMNKVKERLARIDDELDKLEGTRKEEKIKKQMEEQEDFLRQKREEISSIDSTIAGLKEDIKEEKRLQEEADEKKKDLHKKLEEANSHLQRKRISASFNAMEEFSNEFQKEGRLMEKVREDANLNRRAEELKEEIGEKKAEEERKVKEKKMDIKREKEKKRKEKAKKILGEKLEKLSNKANLYFQGADYGKALALSRKIIQTLESPTQEEDVFNEIRKETSLLADMKDLKEKASKKKNEEEEGKTIERRKEEAEKRKEKQEEERRRRRILFEEAVTYYKKGELSDAKDILYKILEKPKEEKRGFLQRLFKGPSIHQKATDLLKEIKKTERKKEEAKKPAVKTKEKEEEKKAPVTGKKKVSKKKQLQSKIEEAHKRYKKNDYKEATTIISEALNELKEEEKKAPFLEKTRFINPLTRKAKRLLLKIKEEKKEQEKREEKKRESIFQREYKKAKEQFENREFDTSLQTSKELLEKLRGKGSLLEGRVKELMEKIDVEKRKEEIIKKHEKELKAQREELRKKQEEEIEKEREKIQQKEKEMSKKDPVLREEEMEDILQSEKMQALKREMERQQEEIIKKYEEKIKEREKELKKKQEEELKKKGEETRPAERIIREVETRPSAGAAETVVVPETSPEPAKEEAPDAGEKTRTLLSQIELQKRMEEELEKKKERLLETGKLGKGDKNIVLLVDDKKRENLDRWATKIRELEGRDLTPEERKKKEEAEKEAAEELKRRREMIEDADNRIEERKEEKRRQREREEAEKREQKKYGKDMEDPERWKERAQAETRRRKLREEVKKRKEQERKKKERGGVKKVESEKLKALFQEGVNHFRNNEFYKAADIFNDIKEQLPEPKKEPGFFSRLLGRVSFYNKVEDYLMKSEKRIATEEMKKIKKIRIRAKKEEREKTKEEKQAPPKWKEEKGKKHRSAGIFRRFLFHQPIVGIDISDYSIEILYMSKTGSILAHGRSIINRGAVQAGEIKDQKALSDALNKAIEQAGFQSFDPRKGATLRAIASLPEYKTYTEIFTFDSKKNLFEQVKEEIKKTIPLPIEDLYWNYIEFFEKKSKKIKVLCVAATKDIVDGQIYILRSSGINPIALDTEAASIGRSLLPEVPAIPGKREKRKEEEHFQKTEENTMILDIGARVTCINIFNKSGFISLSTAVPYGGNYFKSKIADYFAISKEEAEKTMCAKGFQKKDNSLLEVLKESAEQMIEEVGEAMKYYHQETGEDITKIILAGGGALLPEIDKYFEDHFENIVVEIGDPLKKVKRRGGLITEKAILYANAIGLAIRAISRDPVKDGINLLPDEIKNKERTRYWKHQKQKLIVIPIILFAIVAAIALYHFLFNPLW